MAFETLKKLAETPEGKMAMIQTGVSLLQGPAWGESAVSHFGRSIGQGVNNYQRSQMDIRAQEQQGMENQMAQQELDQQGRYYDSQIAKNESQTAFNQARTEAVLSPQAAQLQAPMTEDPIYQELVKNEIANNPANPNLLKVNIQFKTLQAGGRPGDVIAADGGQVLQLQRDELGKPMIDPQGGVTFISHPDGKPVVLPIEQAAQISPDVAREIESQAQGEAASMDAFRKMLEGGLFSMPGR